MRKNISVAFPIQNGLKQGDSLVPLFPTSLLTTPLGQSKKLNGTH